MAKPRATPPRVAGSGRRLRLGLADGVGATLAAVVLLVVPGVGAAATSARFVALLIGGLAVLPFALTRLVIDPDRRAPRVALAAIAWALAGWSVVSALASDAPFTASLFGWYARNTGVLAMVACAGLATAAVTLRVSEARRVVDWLLVAAGLSAVVGLLQALGVDLLVTIDARGVPATLGNPNFAGAFLGLASALAATRALAAWRSGDAPALARWGYPLLAAVLVGVSALSASLQGPVTAVVAWVVAVLAWSFGSGSAPRWTRVASAGAAAVVVVAAVLAALGTGPVGWVRDETTVQVRAVYWRTAAAAAADSPLVGHGPDSLARVVGAFRPEEYLRFRSPEHHVSAAHDVPLQLAATLGVPATLLWLALVLLPAGLLLRRVVRRDAADLPLLAGLAGALAGYAAQALVSVDMLALMATGWSLAGLTAAAALAGAEPDPQAAPGRRPPQAAALRVAAGLLGVGGAVLALGHVGTVDRALEATTVTTATEALTAPATPCALLTPIARRLVASVGPAAALPALATAADQDPDCPGLVETYAQATLNAGDADRAAELARGVVGRDPLNTGAWLLVGFAEHARGDDDAARQALRQAERLAGERPRQFAVPLAALRQALVG